MRAFVSNAASPRRVYTRKVMEGRRKDKDSRINTRQNSRNAGPCATAPQSRYCTYVVVRKRSANCENIIKCRTIELARIGDIFLCIMHLSVWHRRGGLQRTENQQLIIKRKGRIRKRIFIILSASNARRVFAIKTQFNVSDEEKGFLLFTECHHFTALFSPRSSLHYRICPKLPEVHALSSQQSLKRCY